MGGLPVGGPVRRKPRHHSERGAEQRRRAGQPAGTPRQFGAGAGLPLDGGAGCDRQHGHTNHPRRGCAVRPEHRPCGKRAPDRRRGRKLPRDGRRAAGRCAGRRHPDQRGRLRHRRSGGRERRSRSPRRRLRHPDPTDHRRAEHRRRPECAGDRRSGGAPGRRGRRPQRQAALRDRPAVPAHRRGRRCGRAVGCGRGAERCGLQRQRPDQRRQRDRQRLHRRRGGQHPRSGPGKHRAFSAGGHPHRRGAAQRRLRGAHRGAVLWRHCGLCAGHGAAVLHQQRGRILCRNADRRQHCRLSERRLCGRHCGLRGRFPPDRLPHRRGKRSDRGRRHLWPYLCGRPGGRFLHHRGGADLPLPHAAAAPGRPVYRKRRQQQRCVRRALCGRHCGRERRGQRSVRHDQHRPDRGHWQKRRKRGLCGRHRRPERRLLGRGGPGRRHGGRGRGHPELHRLGAGPGRPQPDENAENAGRRQRRLCGRRGRLQRQRRRSDSGTAGLGGAGGPQLCGRRRGLQRGGRGRRCRREWQPALLADLVRRPDRRGVRLADRQRLCGRADRPERQRAGICGAFGLGPGDQRAAVRGRPDRRQPARPIRDLHRPDQQHHPHHRPGRCGRADRLPLRGPAGYDRRGHGPRSTAARKSARNRRRNALRRPGRLHQRQRSADAGRRGGGLCQQRRAVCRCVRRRSGGRKRQRLPGDNYQLYQPGQSFGHRGRGGRQPAQRLKDPDRQRLGTGRGTERYRQPAGRHSGRGGRGHHRAELHQHRRGVRQGQRRGRHCQPERGRRCKLPQHRRAGQRQPGLCGRHCGRERLQTGRDRRADRPADRRDPKQRFRRPRAGRAVCGRRCGRQPGRRAH